jgi:dipeptidyl aminopeptidase/acylaminoacyl peptidase
MLLAATIGLVCSTAARAVPPIEAYGELPRIRSMDISPDGTHVAYLSFADGSEMLRIYELGQGLRGAVRTDNVKARNVFFAGQDYVILRAGKTTTIPGYRGRLEFTGAFSYSLKSGDVVNLPRRMEELYPAQEGLGRIIALAADGRYVLMPGYTGLGQDPPNDLLRINLDNGVGRIAKRGRHETIDWIADENGVVLAREDYDNDSDDYAVYSEIGGKTTKIFELKSNRIPFSLIGVKPDKSGLLLVDEAADEEFSSVYELGFDGKISGPVFAGNDREIDRILADVNRVVIGVEYLRLYPTYEFYDKELEKAVAAAQQYFEGAAVYLESWTEDFSKLLFYVEGGFYPGNYFVFLRDQNGMQQVASTRPDIAPEQVADVLPIEYKARDGLTIPALLTLPLNANPENVPLIVMPHGGPEAHDVVGFDWMAQYFASRGYMILQPNFRGSSGFGAALRDAGAGEWGGKMQDDITDGVNALIRTGRADPSRICIIGASYGGYAALAGGAFTPDLYRCVAAIAPVTDLPAMLREERRDHGAKHWVVDYWQSLIGDPRAERDKLEAISPVNSADKFAAPVLLIHGKDDLVVPISQSRAMERALKRAGKQVEFIEMKGEDHGLSTSEGRLATLKALDAFVARTIGAQTIEAP